MFVKQSQPYEITLTQKSNFGRYADYSGYIPERKRSISPASFDG